MEWKKSGIMVSMALMLGACAHRTPAPVTADVASFNPKVRCSADVDPEHRVALEMVDTLMARGKNHAALAHLQESVQSNQEYWQRYGQLLAKNGDLQRASLVFTAMRDKCESGEAFHGLGMIALKQNNLDKALGDFETAVNLSPASAAVRNDYGYALLLAGQYDNAQYHLRTALELQNGNGQSRQNLAVAYLLGHNQAGLELLQESYHFTDDELAYAKKLAGQMEK